MRTLLLALTGMGNDVLGPCLEWCGAGGVLVVTRAETGPYPYHPCENLTDVCRRLGVACMPGADLADPDTIRAIEDFAPDVSIAATFHQTVRDNVLRLPPRGAFNIHPSMLPAYRGPMPTNWAIIHGEDATGVTVHEMTEKLDQGRIALSRAVEIGGNTDGELRRRLASVAGELAGELLDLAKGNALSLREQEGTGSCHPRVLSARGLELIREGGFKPEDIRRGLTPWPGPEVLEKLIRDGKKAVP